jgi:glycosyltransferase involved in cell wall biosynthesis
MTQRLRNVRIARISTVPFFILTQLTAQIETINSAGASVTVITSNDELGNNIAQLPYCKFQPIYIPRQISFFADVVALYKLWKLFRNQSFDIVHSTTPKAGLLCAIAARLTSIPVRLHTFTGQTWLTMKIPKKILIKFCDRLIGLLNTRCYADSLSQKDFLVKSKIVSKKKISVLGSGSIAGVDTSRFTQDNFSIETKNDIRCKLKVSNETVVILFVGRVTKDKGVYELLEAAHRLLSDGFDISLLIVGPFEQQVEEVLRPYAEQLCGNKVIFTGFSVNPEYFMSVADILCIPSYREGFGTVVIEAAAMGIPVVGTNIYGLSDAIVDGETGLLVEKKNVLQLKDALQKLIKDKDLRKQLGENAKKRAFFEFDSKKFGEFVILEYERLLKR